MRANSVQPSRTAVALWFATVAACSAASQSTPAANEARPHEFFVMVPERAWLYTAPSETSERARLAEQPDSPAFPTVFRLVDDRGGDWVRVESLSYPSRVEHCVTGSLELDQIKLDLYVRRRDLAHVTTREVHIDYDDSTSITLAAGVLLVPAPVFGRGSNAQPVYTAYFNDYMLNTWLAADVIGDRFEPSRHFNDAPSPEVVAPGYQPVFGTRARIGSYANHPRPLYVYRRDELPSVTLATLRTSCAEFVARVSRAGIRSGAAPAERVNLTPERRVGPTARAGAEAYWYDGSHAGSVREDVSFVSELPGTHTRRCFTSSLLRTAELARQPPADSLLRLCFDPSDMRGESLLAAPEDAGVQDAQSTVDAGMDAATP